MEMIYDQCEKLAGIDLRCLPLSDLVRRVVESSDREALFEFHQRRTVFSYQNELHLLFVRFLSLLRDDVMSQGWGGLCVSAYDMTLEKFHSLEGGGIDCRNYFRAALLAFDKVGHSSVVESECSMGRILQSMVIRHFYLSLRECARSGPRSRYQWNLGEHTLTVLMPRGLVGRERREWLETHVPDVDPSRENEECRVQGVVDELLGQTFVPFDESIHGGGDIWDSPVVVSESIRIHGLVETVANEKADRILEQRPAIARLGPKRLRELVCRVLSERISGDCQDSAIAEEFGLNQTTFSRFCGSRWRSVAPDLVQNIASLLANDPQWVEVLRDLGMWRRVRRVAMRSGRCA